MYTIRKYSYILNLGLVESILNDIGQWTLATSTALKFPTTKAARDFAKANAITKGYIIGPRGGKSSLTSTSRR